MKFILGLLVVLAGAANVNASPSAFYNSGEKFMTILESDTVANALRQGPVVSIKEVGPLAYLVSSPTCEVTVELVMHVPEGDQIGKTTYEVNTVTGLFCE